ncbi:hypothetical protein COO60DRAFT_363507 [Scenedesmus sp. NREL 46B-D3]|nr:hypothetical protein COO60DRAFT_363507 [Scenedesmus sp. NREL 46B-D3]
MLGRDVWTHTDLGGVHLPQQQLWGMTATQQWGAPLHGGIMRSRGYPAPAAGCFAVCAPTGCRSPNPRRQQQHGRRAAAGRRHPHLQHPHAHGRCGRSIRRGLRRTSSTAAGRRQLLGGRGVRATHAAPCNRCCSGTSSRPSRRCSSRCCSWGACGWQHRDAVCSGRGCFASCAVTGQHQLPSSAAEQQQPIRFTLSCRACGSCSSGGWSSCTCRVLLAIPSVYGFSSWACHGSSGAVRCCWRGSSSSCWRCGGAAAAAAGGAAGAAVAAGAGAGGGAGGVYPQQRQSQQ